MGPIRLKASNGAIILATILTTFWRFSTVSFQNNWEETWVVEWSKT